MGMDIRDLYKPYPWQKGLQVGKLRDEKGCMYFYHGAHIQHKYTIGNFLLIWMEILKRQEEGGEAEAVTTVRPGAEDSDMPGQTSPRHSSFNK